MSRFARRKDDNHTEVVGWLRAMGCSVETIHGATGMPDIICGLFGLTELVEVKPVAGETRRRELRETQREWHSKWKGRKPVVVRTLDDCAGLVASMRGRMTRSEVAP